MPGLEYYHAGPAQKSSLGADGAQNNAQPYGDFPSDNLQTRRAQKEVQYKLHNMVE